MSKTLNSIGIMGGTFDPPHLGHLILACEAIDQLVLEKVLWVLTPSPPHKEDRDISPLEQRKQLLLDAITQDDRFELSNVDINREEPHYAVDTVLILKEQFPHSKLIYLMGGDSLHDLPTWHDPVGFTSACDQIAVMRRPDVEVDLNNLEVVVPGIAEKVVFIHAPLLFISSSEIRERIKSGRTFKWFLPKKVFTSITNNQYYQ